MRPLSLHGHTRAITMVKYNNEGDLLFTTAKDKSPTVWSTETGERLGTYEGHKGAVWACDVDSSSTFLATASGDATTRIWSVETGDEIRIIHHDVPSRDVSWSHGDQFLACVTDKSMRQKATIGLYKSPPKDCCDSIESSHEVNNSKPMQILTHNEKIMMCKWGPDNGTLFFCSEDGFISVLDTEYGKVIQSKDIHNACEARRISWDSEYATFISAGWDKTAKLIDPRDLSIVQTYESEFNVNDACIVNPSVMNHVVYGGGVDAQLAAKIGSAQNKFEVKFCHKITGVPLGSIAGHFGPVNAIAVEPNGYGYASGGEDGFVKLHSFDQDYFDSPGNLKEVERLC